MTTMKSLPVTETRNLTIREMCLSDWRGLARFLPGSRMLSGGPETVRRHVARAVAQQDLASRASFFLVAEEKTTGTLVADALIKFHEKTVAELSWNIDPVLSGQGYGREVAEVLSAMAIERLGADHVWCKLGSADTVKLHEARLAGLCGDRRVSRADGNGGARQDLCVLSQTAGDYFEDDY